MEWFVFDNLEWVVVLANPESNEISKFSSTVGRAVCTCVDCLVIWSLLFLTTLYMAEQVGCGVIGT